jgi:hypothetical protein
MVRPVTSPSESTFEKPRMILGKDDGGRPRFRVVRVCLRGGNGMFRSGRWGFELGSHERDGHGRSEWFEWKKDTTNASRANRWCGLDLGMEGARQSQSLKLVSSRTGEVKAIFVRAEDEEPSLGLFRFYGDIIGGEFDVLAVMSLLSVVERGRRRGSNRLSKAFRNE